MTQPKTTRRPRWRYTLTDSGDRGILWVDGRWFVHCPTCGKYKPFRILPRPDAALDTVMLEYKCPICGPVPILIEREP